MDNINFKNTAYARFNGDFISIETYSGNGLMLPDPKQEEELLDIQVSNKELGEAVLSKLSASRKIDINDDEF